MFKQREKRDNKQLPKKIRIENAVISLLICILYSNFALLTLSASVIKLLHPIVLCITCSLITIVVYCAMSNKYMRIGIVSLLVLATVSTVIYGIANGGIVAIFTAFGNYFTAISNLLFGTTNVGIGGELSGAVTLAVLLAFFTYVFVEKLLSPVVLFLCNMIIFAIKTLTGDDSGQVYFVFLMGATLLAAAWHAYKNGSKKSSAGQTGFFKLAVFGCIMIGVSLSLASMLPVLRTSVSQNAENLFSIGVVSNYSITDSADEFESSEKLGGPIVLDDSHVFRVSAENRVRLMGEVKTEYNGKKWVSANRSGYIYNGNESEDALELCLNLSRVGIDIKRLGATITPDTVKISTIFVPSHINSMSFDTPYTSYIGSDGTIAVKDYITYTHEVGYIDTDFYNGYTMLEPLLSKTYEGLYSELNDKKYSFDGAVNSVNIEDLEEKADEVRNTCLRLPDNVSQRVIDLAGEITAGMTNDYQKVEAIKNYLRKYKYTLTPDPLPDGAEITDYFLFEGKEGYCSYFATAFAVLCRAEGIPTRYVEGYNSPVEIGEKDESDRYNYSITNKNAHSWVQVYFEGIGWLDFEPTPPFNYSDMGMQVPRDAFAEQDATEGFDVSDEEESTTEPTTAEPENEDDSDNGSVENETTTVPPETQNLPQDNEKDKPFKFTGFMGVIIGLVAVAALVVVLYFVTKKRRVNRIERAENTADRREATGLSYALIERAGKLFGCERQPSQTAKAYIDQLCEKFNIDGKDIAEMIDKGLYSKAQSKDNITRIVDFYEELYDAGADALHPVKRTLLINWLHMG